MQLQKAIETRRSIRKFLPDPLSDEQIRQIVQAGMQAPSGCNSQCWKFVAVRQPEEIQEVARQVEKAVRSFYSEAEERFVRQRIVQTTFFKNAPLVFFIFCTQMEYHDPRVTEYYGKRGYTPEQMLQELGQPDLLSVGAAVENMLLTIHEMGLGGCWMNDPLVARDAICRTLGMPPDSRLVSVLPVGKPAYHPREKAMKQMEDVLVLR